MLVKTSIAAAALISGAVSLSSVDFRELYNEMYPVNGLKRDVLDLCRDAKPTFIRAMRTDRIGCYDSMPDAIDRAIGWVRTSSRLAAMNRTPTAVDIAERLLIEAAAQGRIGAPGPRFTGYATGHPVGQASQAGACGNPAAGPQPAAAGLALTGSDYHLARQIADGDALAALGIALRRARRDRAMADQELPVLPLDGAVGSSSAPAADATATASAALLKGLPALSLGDDIPVPAPPPGCRAPA